MKSRANYKRLNAAISGECQFVVVSNEPGVGKARAAYDEGENLARERSFFCFTVEPSNRMAHFPTGDFVTIGILRLKDTVSSPQP